MPTVHRSSGERQTLHLSVEAGECDLIDRAALASGRNRDEFILDATRRAVEETLLDQALRRVDPETFAAFQARLDAPPAPNERLRATMRFP